MLQPLIGKVTWTSGSQSVVTGSAASASPGNLTEMQYLGFHLRLNESETLHVVPAGCVLTTPPDDSDALKF